MLLVFNVQSIGRRCYFVKYLYSINYYFMKQKYILFEYILNYYFMKQKYILLRGEVV